MKQHRIPVAVVSGFLGAGKTTLLNNLLANRLGLRVGVVVNDFGEINIDAMSVAGQVDSTVALGNGCLCCAVDTTGLDAMLERLARPNSGIDVIVIEASGLADPRGIVRMILNSESERITYGGTIEVVDAAEFDTTRAEHPQWDQHLRFADLIVVNKTDRVDRQTRQRLGERVCELGEGAPVYPTTRGNVEPTLLFDVDAVPKRRDDVPRQLTLDELMQGDPDDDHGRGDRLHCAYESVTFTADRPLSPGRLMRFLDQRHAGIYRMKGFVDFDVPKYRRKFAFQGVGNFLRFRPIRWSRGERRRTELVLIGRGIDREAVRAGLNACVRSESEEVSADDILPILRYTETTEPETARDIG